jgi:hypothetical protein
MCHKRLSILGIALTALLAMAPLFAFTILGNKVGIVDVYIETYVVNGIEATSLTDVSGNEHISGKDFYLRTAVKGTMGGAVKFRFFMERVNLTIPECPDSLPKYKFDPDKPLTFKDSYAEMIDSASVPPEIFAKLPTTFTNPRGR